MPAHEAQGDARRPLRILLAEDDDCLRAALATALGDAAIDVVGQARDGLEAVGLFSELAPDVVVVDVAMPRCDGVEAIQRILAIDPDARIIVVTGASGDRLLTLCARAGAKAYVKKDALEVLRVMLPLMSR